MVLGTHFVSGVFLAYASRHGHVLLDHTLYLPQGWAVAREWRERAGIPAVVSFATKPASAHAMLQRALGAAVPVRWVTADSIYGDYRPLRTWLESQSSAYVLGVSGKEAVEIEGWMVRVSELAQVGLAITWTRLSSGDGAKGPRLFDWKTIPLTEPPVPGWRRWLLACCSFGDESDLTTYVLCLHCHRANAAYDPGRNRRQPLAHRTVLRRDQRRGGVGAL